MAIQYLDLAGLQKYDGQLKTWVKNTAVEQVATLPATSKLGTIVEYVGGTTTDLTQGYFYICQAGDVDGTFTWKQINVQPQVDVTNVIDDTKAANDTTYSSNKIDAQIKANAKDGIYKPESVEGAGDEVTIAAAIAALEVACTLNYKGTAAATVTDPADGDLYYFNIPAVEGVSDAVVGWKFWSATDANWKELNDATLATRVATLETQVGKDKVVTTYQSKDNLVEIVNVLTGDDTVAGSVAKVVKDAVADLEGAMHFMDAVTPVAEQTDADAIKAWYLAQSPAVIPAKGDVFVIATNSKEYVVVAVDESNVPTVREIGDEGLYVQKSTKIAGIDLQDDITDEELRAALGVSNEGIVFKGTVETAPATAILGDAYLVGSALTGYQLKICTTASDADTSTDAAYTAVAIDSNYLNVIAGTGYKIADIDATIKAYIDSRIFVGTQDEYDAKIAAKTIDTTTFAIITDEGTGDEIISAIPDDEIDALFA